MPPPVVRPSKVTILGILQILLGILVLLGGIALSFAGFALPEMLPQVRFFATRSMLSGLGLVGLALIDFILAYGLWNGKGWAWIASLIFAVLGIGFSTFSLFIRPRIGEFVALVIDLVISYYLMQPHVQRYFGKGAKLISFPIRGSQAVP